MGYVVGLFIGLVISCCDTLYRAFIVITYIILFIYIYGKVVCLTCRDLQLKHSQLTEETPVALFRFRPPDLIFLHNWNFPSSKLLFKSDINRVVKERVSKSNDAPIKLDESSSSRWSRDQVKFNHSHSSQFVIVRSISQWSYHTCRKNRSARRT